MTCQAVFAHHTALLYEPPSSPLCCRSNRLECRQKVVILRQVQRRCACRLSSAYQMTRFKTSCFCTGSSASSSTPWHHSAQLSRRSCTPMSTAQNRQSGPPQMLLISFSSAEQHLYDRLAWGTTNGVRVMQGMVMQDMHLQQDTCFMLTVASMSSQLQKRLQRRFLNITGTSADHCRMCLCEFPVDTHNTHALCGVGF